ncbi:MAG TPA: MFS transporter [Phycisphaerales bacterium]|nr:MFS transporter [Phycisphaerales bacterium]
MAAPVVDATARSGVGTRLAAVIVSHALVDVYSAFIAPLLGVLEIRCKLTAVQAAWLLGIGSLTSGFSQPIAAWLSDRVDSRLCGALGLGLAAICLSAIGLADSYWTLLPLYVLGMIGSGIYHPIGAASMGQLASRFPGNRRAIGISVFHAAGMIGGITGSIISTRIATEPGGFDLLRWLMIPGIVAAFALHMLIRGTSHRHHQHREMRFVDGEIHERWRTVFMLYISNAIRFTVNMALVYLFVRWSQEVIAQRHPSFTNAQVAADAAPINGNLNAMLLVGMLIGGISAGALVKAGREKWPMILVPLLFAPCIALMPRAGIGVGYGLAVGCGLAFAAMVPVSISVAQRMLPHRTSLASGLMLGGAWALAFIGPRAAEWCMASAGLSLTTTFTLTAALLATSSLVCLPMDSNLLHCSAADAKEQGGSVQSPPP